MGWCAARLELPLLELPLLELPLCVPGWSCSRSRSRSWSEGKVCLGFSAYMQALCASSGSFLSLPGLNLIKCVPIC